MYQGLKYLEIKREEKILLVWLQNPPVNALSSALMQELKRVLQQAATDKNVRLLIITGKGKLFSAGADIKELEELSRKDLKSRKAFVRENNTVLDKIENFPKPVIALINGHAVGGGCELALACHLRFASSEAQIGLPEIKLGIFPGWGGTWRLPKLIGESKALEMILTGNTISANEALKIGLVNRVADSTEILQATEDFAKSLIDKPREALEPVHVSIIKGMNQKAVGDIFADLLGKKCAREGIKAFLEKHSSKNKS